MSPNETKGDPRPGEKSTTLEAEVEKKATQPGATPKASPVRDAQRPAGTEAATKTGL